MKSDAKTSVVAFVDLDQVKYKKPDDLGIDFFNEIDVWAQMQFKFRNRAPSGKRVMAELNSVYYSLREQLD